MPVWSVKPVVDEPSLRVELWSVRETVSGERYIVGHRTDKGTARVSTLITEIDVQKMLAKTQSGRVYRLIGEWGCSSDTDYVWEAYCQINKIDSSKCHNVSEEVWGLHLKNLSEDRS